MQHGDNTRAGAGPETPQSSCVLFFRPTVQPGAVILMAQMIENGPKIVIKLPCCLAGLPVQRTVTCSVCLGGRGL